MFFSFEIKSRLFELSVKQYWTARAALHRGVNQWRAGWAASVRAQIIQWTHAKIYMRYSSTLKPLHCSQSSSLCQKCSYWHGWIVARTQLLPINYKDEQVIFFNKGGWSGLRLVLFACSSLVFVSHGHLYFLNYYYYYCFLLDLDRWRTYGKMYRQKRTKTTSTIIYLVLTRWYGVV